MKILVLANSGSGLLSFRREVMSALVSNGHEVAISVPEDDCRADVEALGCRVIPVVNLERRGMNPMRDIMLLREYRKLMKRERPDVVLTYTIKPNVWGGIASKRSGVPYIVNITGLGTAVENGGVLQTLTVSLYRMAVAKAVCIFFQNSANRSFFAQRGINVNAHRLIPGSGVNLRHHRLQPYPSEDEPVRFLFISRLMRQKGIEEYFACAERFRGKAEFHILGSCEEDYQDMLEELQQSGTVVYHGQQKDVRGFIGRSHCLVHPSYYPEGMSNVIQESAAAGRPVITTDRAGCREVVDDGVSGYVVAERDREALVAAVERFLELPYQEKEAMGRRGREKMEREFDRNIVVRAYMDAINEIK